MAPEGRRLGELPQVQRNCNCKVGLVIAPNHFLIVVPYLYFHWPNALPQDPDGVLGVFVGGG